jgi:uncharacterized protein DUF3253
VALSGEDVERAIVALLERRGDGKTICPSDAARALGGEDWQALLRPVREQARTMVASGRLEVTQSGRVVDPDTARGAIRLRLPPSRPPRR